MFEKSFWIWNDITFKTNERVNFKKSFNIKQIPDEALLRIACETKYWLFINKKLVVFDGGLFRESTPGNGWYDEIDISNYLNLENNEIVFHVWYYGNGGRNNTKIEKGGLIFECLELNLYSDTNTFSDKDYAYYTTQNKNPSYLYGGFNTAFDSRKYEFKLIPDVKGNNSIVVGNYGDKPWGMMEKRFVPQLYFSDRIKCDYSFNNDYFSIKLDRNMQVSPYMILEAQGNEVCEILTDRYIVRGGPGDDNNQYCGHRAEYICRKGIQEFEMRDWIVGEEIKFFIPKGVRIIELGYRESRYDSNITGSFKCDNEKTNILFNKCVNTLRVCMRENYMDCPDRERGQWIGDVSVQSPQIIYLLDDNGLKLLKKAIYDFIRLRKGNVLVGNVPGDNFCELPSQSLNAVSEIGMISIYYQATGDIEILKLVEQPQIDYLSLWSMEDNGMPKQRNGNWKWYDHLYNNDEPILEACWYYSALRFALTIAKKLNHTNNLKFIKDRMKSIEDNFDRLYWKNEYFSSGNIVDDRANAMVILSHLCKKEHYESIRKVLLSVFNSTTYMENYVLMALCEMGYKEDAFTRMMCRYQPLIDNDNSTLWEDFFRLGTKNHAWSGGPATILMRYFAGVNLDLTINNVKEIKPLKHINCEFNKNGKKINIRI